MRKMFDTVLWTFRKQWQYTKVSFLMLLTGCLLYVGEQFLALYLPKTVVAGVLANEGLYRVLLKVSLLLGGIFLTEAVINLFGTMNFAYFARFRNEMQYEAMQKNMSMDYMTLESPKYRDLFFRGMETLFSSGKHSPLTKLADSTMELMQNVLGYLLFGTVISFLNPWIIVLLTLTPAIHYVFMRRYSNYEYANRKHWTPIERKLNYVVGSSRSFATAKDIRIYGLNTWFTDTYKALSKERMAWNMKLMKKSLPVNLSDLLVILLRDGLAYAILISMTLEGKISIDEFVLYFAAIGSFGTWIGGIIEKWSEIHELSLQILDLKEILEWKTAEETALIKSSELSEPCGIELTNLRFQKIH